MSRRKHRKVSSDEQIDLETLQSLPPLLQQSVLEMREIRETNKRARGEGHVGRGGPAGMRSLIVGQRATGNEGHRNSRGRSRA